MKPAAVPVSFGALLREHRAASGLSQEELADRAGLSAAAIGALERGRRRAPYEVTVVSLADALELAPEKRAAFIDTAKRTRARNREVADNASHGAGAIPTFFSSFVGRIEELAVIREMVTENRLVTITGSGGVGKTRIACELLGALAKTDQRRIAYVDLTPITERSLIIGKVASSLGVDGIASQELLLMALGPQKVVLVLDNCEHLVHSIAPFARALLVRCSGASIIATSRIRLGITGEAVYRLPSLALPSDVNVSIVEAMKFAALELFIERTKSVDPIYRFTAERLAVTVDICRRLSGIPLAIELAAARVPSLGLVDIRDRLFEQFLLTNDEPGLPARQRTMTATIAWSCDLLGDAERILLRRLAIFAGGFTLRAAELVCADSTLQAREIPLYFTRLVDCCLVNANTDQDNARYGFAESTRNFSLDRLCEAKEYAAIARRHAQWLAEMADRGFGQSGAAQLDVVQEATRELENVHAALDWCLASDSDDDAIIAGRILGGMRFLFTSSYRRIEFRRLIEQTLGRVDSKQYPQIVAPLYRGLIQTMSGNEIDNDILQAATSAFDQINDYAALANMNAGLISMFLDMGDIDKAEAAAVAGHSFITKGDLHGGLAHIALLMNESEILTYRGRFEEGRSNLLQARRFIERLGAPELDLYRRTWLVLLEAGAGHLRLATEIAVEASKLVATQPDTPSRSFVAESLEQRLGLLYTLQGDLTQAASFVKAPPRNIIDLPHLHYVKFTLQAAATVAALQHRFNSAARLLGFIESTLAQARVRRDLLSQLCCDQGLTILRASRTEAELDALFAEGTHLTFTQACDEALKLVVE